MLIIGKESFTSPYCRFCYKPRKLYKSKIELNENGNSIFEGFHSYSTLKKGRKRQWLGEIALCEFIIPKRSEYFYNLYKEEIVSNQIYWTGRVWRTDRWIEFKRKVTKKMILD